MDDSRVLNRSLVKQLRQTGKHYSVPRDRGRLAIPAGKRISKSGKIYWETRKNRTDVPNTRL